MHAKKYFGSNKTVVTKVVVSREKHNGKIAAKPKIAPANTQNADVIGDFPIEELLAIHATNVDILKGIPKA